MTAVDAVFMVFRAPGEFITPDSQITMVGLTVMLCNCRFQSGPALSLGLPPTDLFADTSPDVCLLRVTAIGVLAVDHNRELIPLFRQGEHGPEFTRRSICGRLVGASIPLVLAGNSKRLLIDHTL